MALNASAKRGAVRHSFVSWPSGFGQVACPDDQSLNPLMKIPEQGKAAANFIYRRERPLASSAALRSDRAEGAGVGTGRRNGLCAGRWVFGANSRLHTAQDTAALDGFADGD